MSRQKLEQEENSFTKKSNLSLSIGEIDLIEISNKALHFGIGLNLNGLLNVSGNSQFEALLEAHVGIDENKLGIFKIGFNDIGEPSLGLHLNSKDHETNLISFLTLLSETTLKETTTNVLPILIKKPTSVGSTTNDKKCYFKNVFESLTLGTTIPLPSLKQYHGQTFNEIRIKLNNNTVDVCEFSSDRDKTDNDDKVCTLPRPRRRRSGTSTSPSPSESRTSGSGGLPNINFAVIPNKITWLESTRPDVATIELKYTIDQTESLIPGSTIKSSSTSKYMLEAVTAPFVIEEKNSQSTITVVVKGSDIDGSMSIELSFCMGGPACSLKQNAPAPPTESVVPKLLSSTLNGDEMNINIGTSSDSSVLMLNRILSIIDLSWYVPKKVDGLRARYFDPLIAVSPPGTSESAINYAKWLNSANTQASTSATHKRDLNIPSAISNIIPTIDMGVLSYKYLNF